MCVYLKYFARANCRGKKCELAGGATRARNRPPEPLQTQPRSYLTVRARVHRIAVDMDGNEKKNMVEKPCAACKERKKCCPHKTLVPRTSQEWACAECRRLRIKCWHNEPPGGAGAAARTLSYADVVRAPPPRALSAAERLAAEAFMAPDPVAGSIAPDPVEGNHVKWEVMYFLAPKEPGHNPALR